MVRRPKLILFSVLGGLILGLGGPGKIFPACAAPRTEEVLRNPDSSGHKDSHLKEKTCREANFCRQGTQINNIKEAWTRKSRSWLNLKPLTLLTRAWIQAQQGQTLRSCQTYLRFINLYPRHPQCGFVFLKLAEGQSRLGHKEVAKQCYQMTENISPVPEIVQQARLGRLTLEFYQQLDQGDPIPVFRHFWQQISGWQEIMKHSGAGRVHLQKALAAGWKAIVPRLIQKSPENLKTLEKVLELWEQMPPELRPLDGALQLGKLFQSQGLYLAAQKFLGAVAGQGDRPSRQEAWRHLAEINLQRQDFKALERVLRQWRREQGELPPEFLVRLGQAQLANGQAAAAAQTLKETVQTVDLEMRSECVTALAQAYHQTGQARKAIGILEGTLENELPTPDSIRLRRRLAQLYFAQGNFLQAAQTYQQLRASPLSSIEARFCLVQLGLCYQKAGQHQQAKEIFQQLAQTPEEFWQKLAGVYIQEGQWSGLNSGNYN